MKGKKAQSELFLILTYVVLGLIYYIGLAPMVSELCTVSVIENNITGLYAFFFMNINVFITAFYVISGLAIGRYSLG